MSKKIKRQNILKLAKALETSALKKRDIGFNMAVVKYRGMHDFSGNRCGTVCCIAGWTQEIFGTDDAEGALGISSLQADQLFMPPRYCSNPEQYTLARSVAVLRNLAKTGDVAWEKFDRDGSVSKRKVAS